MNEGENGATTGTIRGPGTASRGATPTAAEREVPAGTAGAIAPPTGTPHADAWRALASTHAAVVQRLQEALAASEFPPLPWYEVLATVAEDPEGRMRMGDLAEALVITRGGLTKLVDRLVRAGLMERAICDADRRVSYATVLPAGSELLEEMRPVVVAELEAAFVENLSERQAEELRRTLERVRVSACGEG